MSDYSGVDFFICTAPCMHKEKLALKVKKWVQQDEKKVILLSDDNELHTAV